MVCLRLRAGALLTACGVAEFQKNDTSPMHSYESAPESVPPSQEDMKAMFQSELENAPVYFNIGIECMRRAEPLERTCGINAETGEVWFGKKDSNVARQGDLMVRSPKLPWEEKQHIHGA